MSQQHEQDFRESQALYEEAAKRLRTASRAHGEALESVQEITDDQRQRIKNMSQRLEDLRKEQDTKHGHHKSRHDALHNRVTDIETKHHGHASRLQSLEQKHSDTKESLDHLSTQQKWLAPAVTGLAVAGGVAALWWVMSKVFGKRGGQSQGDSQGQSSNGSDRVHSRDFSTSDSKSGKYSDGAHRRYVVRGLDENDLDR